MNNKGLFVFKFSILFTEKKHSRTSCLVRQLASHIALGIFQMRKNDDDDSDDDGDGDGERERRKARKASH